MFVSLKVFTMSFITLKNIHAMGGAGIHKDKTKQKNSKVVEFCFLGCESLTVFHGVPGSRPHPLSGSAICELPEEF